VTFLKPRLKKQKDKEQKKDTKVKAETEKLSPIA